MEKVRLVLCNLLTCLLSLLNGRRSQNSATSTWRGLKLRQSRFVQESPGWNRLLCVKAVSCSLEVSVATVSVTLVGQHPRQQTWRCGSYGDCEERWWNCNGPPPDVQGKLAGLKRPHKVEVNASSGHSGLTGQQHGHKNFSRLPLYLALSAIGLTIYMLVYSNKDLLAFVLWILTQSGSHKVRLERNPYMYQLMMTMSNWRGLLPLQRYLMTRISKTSWEREI